jgi:glycosyltransferase involved in cell wall biosynthesis
VSFFAMKHPKNLPCDQERYFVEHIDFAELSRRKSVRNGARVLFRSIYSVSARRRLGELLREVRPDIAHLQNVHAHLTPSVLHALRDAGVPAVWTLHDFKLICPNTHLLSHGRICEACKGNRFHSCVVKRCKKDSYAASLVAALEAEAHRFLDIPSLVSQFIAPSEFLRNKFVEFGWSKDRLVHLRNFLHRDQFAEASGEDGGYALYLGQLAPWKGVRTLLAACERLPRMRLVIAGDGSERAELERTVAERHLSGVRFAGHLDGSQLRDLLRGCSFVVAPSESYENCPYAVMEAMAAGKPVIASRIGGLPELVEDGETGLLVEPANASVLAEALDHLNTDTVLRRQLGDGGRRSAFARFSPDEHYERLARLYDNARGASALGSFAGISRFPEGAAFPDPLLPDVSQTE